MNSPRLEQALDEIARAVQGGVDAKDLALICEKAMVAAEELGKVDKRGEALKFATALVDEHFAQASPELEQAIRDYDFPYVPEGIEASILDPVVIACAPHIVKWVIIQALPSVFDLVVRGTRGGLLVNSRVEPA